MAKPVPNSRVDAIVRAAEDVVIVAGTACTTWLASHSLDDTLTAVAAAPIVRSGIAAALSSGRVSGLVLAVKLVRQALHYIDEVVQPTPAPAAEPTPEPAAAS